MKTYTIQIYKSYHKTLESEKTYPNSVTALYYINAFSNMKFRDMQDVYKYQNEGRVIGVRDGNSLVLTMRKDGKVIETNKGFN